MAMVPMVGSTHICNRGQTCGAVGWYERTQSVMSGSMLTHSESPTPSFRSGNLVRRFTILNPMHWYEMSVACSRASYLFQVRFPEAAPATVPTRISRSRCLAAEGGSSPGKDTPRNGRRPNPTATRPRAMSSETPGLGEAEDRWVLAHLYFPTNILLVSGTVDLIVL